MVLTGPNQPLLADRNVRLLLNAILDYLDSVVETGVNSERFFVQPADGYHLECPTTLY
jgi:hypothetical protein